MAALRELYRWLVRRLPPRAAWALWRSAVAVAAVRRRAVAGPEIAVAELAWGASEEELTQIVERLVESFDGDPDRLLVISDADAVHVAAARRCRLEHVPARTDWEGRFPAGDYDAFLAGRIESIAAGYRISRVRMPAEGPPALGAALAAAGIELERSEPAPGRPSGA